jgi:hypothetical protein
MATSSHTDADASPGLFEPGEKPVLEFHLGPTGSGKSRAVFEKYPDEFYWCLAGGSAVWPNDYKGELIIVFDDYRGELPFPSINQLCSFMRCSFQSKGGPEVQVMAKKFVFTSTTEPELWYDDPEGEWARRIREFGVKIYYPLAAAAR